MDSAGVVGAVSRCSLRPLHGHPPSKWGGVGSHHRQCQRGVVRGFGEGAKAARVARRGRGDRRRYPVAEGWHRVAPSMTRRLRLPSSPIEQSVEARAFVFSGFAVAVLGIVLYGQDYVVPAIGLIAAAAGHVVSYRERNQKREFWRQAFLAAMVFGALFYVIADSSLALFGGVLPQANFAILLVAVTSFDLKTRRNCYSSLWISLAIVYLAAVYAWDYAFGILLALWALYLAGFWIASHLKRMEAGVRVPARALALMLAAAILGGVGWFVAGPPPPRPAAFPPGGLSPQL